MSNMQHFPNISYVSAGFRVEISLDRFSKQLAEAQQWLGDRVLEDSKPYMPHLTGSLQQRSYVAERGAQVVYPGPYGRFQYGGKVMVDEVTGSPWARAGAKKVLTDQDLRYSRAEATDHWFDTAKAEHGEYWIAHTKQIAGGG